MQILQKIGENIVVSVIGGIILAIVGALFWFGIDSLESRPVTAKITGNKAGEASTFGFYQEQIRPELAKVCARPNWKAWLGRKFLNQKCTRLVFEPTDLEKMITRRVPFTETAPPLQLLGIFVGHHNGCVSMKKSTKDDDDIITIEQSSASQLVKEDKQFICP